MRTILSLLTITLANLSYALDSADLLILKKNINEANQDFGAPQLAFFIDDTQNEVEKTILKRMQAIYQLKNKKFDSNKSDISTKYIDRISQLDNPSLNKELKTQFNLLTIISASNDELNKGQTIASLDPAIFEKPQINELKITGTSIPQDSLTQQSPLKLSVQKIEDALTEIEKDENKGLYNLAKLSFQIKNPILQGAVIKTTLLGLINNKHPKSTSYRLAVEKKLGKEMTSFFYGSDFFKTCSRCKGDGQTEKDCRTCEGGNCTNNTCSGGLIVYKGLNGKIIRKDCPTCKGTAKCQKCAGAGQVFLPCRTCTSRGKIFTPENVPGLYVQAIGQLRNLALDIVKNPNMRDPALMANNHEIELPELPPVKKVEPPPPPVAPKINNRFNDDGMNSFDFDPPKIGSQVTEGKTPEHLKLVLEEFYDRLRAQQRQNGVTLASKIYAMDKDNNGNYKTTLYLTATNDFLADPRKKDILIGLFEFWKMRCGSNGVLQVGGACILVLDAKDKVIGIANSATDITI